MHEKAKAEIKASLLMIRMGSSDIRPIDRKRILEVLASGRLSPDKFCHEFEVKFAKFVGRKYALFVNSGTDALRLALLAMKRKYKWPDGSNVIVPAITFPATLNVVIQANLTPLIYDANPHLWSDRLENPDKSQVDAVAMIPVHMFGELSPMPELMAFAKENNIRVLEDSCEMVGETAGSWGDCAAFSTYACHHLNTGVGGLAVTDDSELHEIMRSLANHGRDTSYLPGYRTPKVITPAIIASRFRFIRAGYSCRATEFQAALGLGQLERYTENLSKRRILARALIRGLLPFWSDLHVYDNPKHTYMMFPVLIKQKSKVKKNELVWSLEKAGVETRDMMPILNQPIFQKYIIPQNTTRRMADEIGKNGFYVPIHPKMTLADVKVIVGVIRKSLTTLS